jgi:hypothetical protein
MTFIQVLAVLGVVITSIVLSYIIPGLASLAYFQSKLEYQKKYMNFLACNSEQQKEVG